MYCLDSIPDDFFVVPKFQHDKNIRIVYLTETGKPASCDLLNGDDTGIMPVKFSKRIFKGLRLNLLFRYMKNVLIYLLGRTAV